MSLEVLELLGGKADVPELHDLFLEPNESLARQLLLGCAVCEGVGDRDIFEILEDGALHRQLVQIGVEEGDDTRRVRQRAVKVHGWRWLLCGRAPRRVEV